MLKINDQKVKENDEIAEPFNEYFVSIAEKLTKEIDPLDISSTQVKQTESKNSGSEKSHRQKFSIRQKKIIKKWNIIWIISYFQQSSENCKRPQQHHLLIFSVLASKRKYSRKT